jgi:hypothetical protein
MLNIAVKMLVQEQNSLNPLDFLLRTIRGDGNCMFRAICGFDFYSKYTDAGTNHITLRRKVVFHIRRVYADPTHRLHEKYTEEGFLGNITNNNGSIENLCERINATTTGWGDYSDLPFISDLLNIEFRVLNKFRQENTFTKIMETKHCWYPTVTPSFPDENTVVSWLYQEKDSNHYTAMQGENSSKLG